MLRVLEVDAPAVVIGSSQRETDVDRRAAEAAGVEVVRRGSGGGAVLLLPDEHVWVDAWLPAGDPLWVDDVVRAGEWMGEAWARSAVTLGFEAEHVAVHRGRVRASAWSAQVCFAGRGPGEVFVSPEGQKLTGLSQRRTRDWIRQQVLVHRRWDAAATFALLAGDPGARRRAAEAHAETVATVGAADAVAALVTALP